MTIVTQEAYNAALLAEAIYLNFSSGAVGNINENRIEFRRLLNQGYPASLATHIADNFDSIVDSVAPASGASGVPCRDVQDT